MNLEDQKASLLSLREELHARVERTHRHLHQREDRVSSNFSDQSQEMDNQQLVYNLDQEGRQELAQIESALRRIAEGTYGACEQCGEVIQDARIEAVPYTKHCIECAVSLEE